MVPVAGTHLDVQFMGDAVAELVRCPDVVEGGKKFTGFLQLLTHSSREPFFPQSKMQKLVGIQKGMFGVGMGLDFFPFVPEKPYITLGKTTGTAEEDKSRDNQCYRQQNPE